MKSLKSKVIMSAVVLAFALLATIGSTYAWFTVSQQVTVSAINMNVTTEENLLIRLYDNDDATVSTTPTDYYHNISNADFNNTTIYSANPYYSSDAVGGSVGAGGDVLAAALVPLTAAYQTTPDNTTDYDILNISHLSSINIGVTTDRTLTDQTGTLVNTSAGGYIEVKFWLMTQSAGKTIVLSDLEVTTTGGDATAVSAVRVGVLGDDGLVNHVYAYGATGPDYGFEFLATDTGYSATPALNTVETTTLPAGLASLHSVFYEPISSGGADGTTTLSSATTILTLAAALTPELVTVRIWIEGWDAQATNDIMAATFDVAFGFRISNPV